MTWVQQAGWRILVALDGTPQAQRALTYASALAHDTNGTIVMIRAGDPEADSGLFSLRASARRLRQIGLVVDTHVVEGEDAAAVIVAAACSRQVDWIVMATEKSAVVDRLLNGSVTDAVVKAAPVPVLVIPPHCERTISRDHSLRVIVPLDGSKAGERALIPVLDLAKAVTTEVVLVRTTQAKMADADRVHDYLVGIRTQLERLLCAGGVEAVVTGLPPVQAIINAVRVFNADAVAISTEGRTGMTPLGPGSIATSMLELSTVPLLLIGPNVPTRALAAQLATRTPFGDAPPIGRSAGSIA